MFRNTSVMHFTMERRVALVLLVFAFSVDIRVSSSALPHVIAPPEAFFPMANNDNNYLGYFEEREDDFGNGRWNSTEVMLPPVSGLVGGEYAKIGQFPWMAVVHRLVGGGRISMCGGTIISVRWILTAGHCVADSPRKFFIVLGEVDKTGIGYDFYNGPGVSMMTTKGALHPQYGKGVNDVAMLWMPRDIIFNDVIKPIRLAGQNEANENFDGKTALIVGWGRDGPQSSGTKELKFGSIPIISNSECARTWGIDQRNICTAPGTGTDACQGDSGGPLIVKMNNEYVQVGVVSYGDADCPSSLPGVFSRVTAFNDWINQVTSIKY